MKNKSLTEVGPNRFTRDLVWYHAYSFSTVQLPVGEFCLYVIVFQLNMASEHFLSRIPQE